MRAIYDFSRGGLAVLVLLLVLAAPASAAPGDLVPIGCIQETGEPLICDHSAPGFQSDAEALAASPDGRFVYSGGSVLTAWRRGADGRLGSITCYDAGPVQCGAQNQVPGLVSTDALAFSPDGSTLYAVGNANIGSGSVNAFHVNADGTLTSRGCFNAGGDSCGVPNELGDKLRAANSVAVSRDGAYVYVTAGAYETLLVFTRAADGSLTYKSCKQASGTALCGVGNAQPSLQGVTGVAVGPGSTSVYTAAAGIFDQFDGYIARFTRVPNGDLAFAECAERAGSVAPCGVAVTGLRDPENLVVANDRVYVAARDVNLTGTHSSLTTLTRNPGTGALSAGSCIATPGSPECPGAGAAAVRGIYNLQLSPAGTQLYTTALGTSNTTGSVATFVPGAAAPAFRSCVGSASSTGCGSSSPGITGGVTALAVSPDGRNVYAGGEGIIELAVEQPPAPVNARPALSKLRFSKATFRRGSKRPKLAAKRKAKAKAKAGTTIGFTLSEAAKVTFTFERRATGRKVGKSCRKPSRKNRSRKHCMRYVKVKGRSFSVAGKAGRNRVAFTGQVTKRGRLALGRYRLVATAKDPQGLRSKTLRAKFRIKR